MVDVRFYELISHLYRSGAWAHYWTPDGPQRADGSVEKVSLWFSTTTLSPVPKRWIKLLNVYFSVHPGVVKRSQHQRVTVATIAAINCLIAEFDAKDFHSKADALAHIMALMVPPSVVIDSGGGYHCYWLLDQPFAIETDGDRQYAANIQTAWNQYVGGDHTVHDLARVLRIPGTLNHKYSPPSPVEIVDWQPERLYSLGSIATLVDPIIAGWQVQTSPSPSPVDLDDQELLDKALNANDGGKFQDLWNGGISDYNNDHSKADQALCNILAFWTGGDIHRMDVLFRRSGLMRDKWDRADYRDATLQKAINDATAFYTPGDAQMDPDAVKAAQSAIGAATNGTTTANGAAPKPKPKKKRNPPTAKPSYTEIGREYMKLHPDMMFARGAWYRYALGVWSSVADNVVEREIWTLLEAKETPTFQATLYGVANVAGYVKANTFVPEDRLDADDGLINLLNGTYSLELRTLLTHDKSRYLTTQLPFNFDPAAKCPYWDHYMKSSFIHSMAKGGTFDPELANFVLEAMGYSLTTDIKYHVTFWCYGEGANGKGVLFHVLEKLAGNAATPFNVNLLHREQYQLADLAGKRIALCAEADSNGVVEDAVIKQLVAGDSLQVRQIRREPFTLYPRAKLWWSMNKLPTVTDTSTGFWRRIVVIPFNANFQGGSRIDDLKGYLDDELPGIFNQVLAGLFRLQANGKFSTVQQIQDWTTKYQAESNTILSFVEDTCEVDINYNVQSSIIYRSYREWCSDNGYKPYNARNFKTEMERLSYYHRRTMTMRVYDGIRIQGAGNAIP
jgi:putative DNA primase/helicase